MSAVTTALRHRKFSVEEYHHFIEQGFFKHEERIELWEGEFVEMSPIGKRHAGSVDFIADYLREILGRKVIIRVQSPIILDDLSEPQPDVCLLKRREDFYRHTDAMAKDVLLAIEVADSTVRYDRDTKFPRYATNGIKEAWLIDLENDRVEIHSEPTEFGYSLVKISHRGQIAESNVFPEIKIAVEDILG